MNIFFKVSQASERFQMKIVRLGRLQMKILRLREAPNKEFEDLGPWKGGGLNFFGGGGTSPRFRDQW